MSRATFLTGAAALGLGTVAGLSGCSRGAENPGEVGTVEGSSIVLQTTAGLEPRFKEFVDAYTKEFPDRKIEVRGISDNANQYAQLLATARISGEMPDLVFNVNFLSDTLANANVTLDLAPGIADGKLGDLTLDDFLPQFLGEYRPLNDPDAVTGLPISADSTALFYNGTVFDKAGVSDRPTADSTWEELFELAKRVHDGSDGALIGMQSPLGQGGNRLLYAPVLKAFGAKIYDIDANTTDIGSPEAVKGWTLLMKSYGDVSIPYSASPQTDPGLKFQSGNVAMAVNSSAAVPGYRKPLDGQDWDVVQLPKINGKTTSSGGSYGMSITQSSKNQDAAWAFLAWFYDIDKGMKVAQQVANAIPPTDEGIEHGSWREVTPPDNIAIFAEAAREAELGGRLPGNVQNTLSDALVKAVQQVQLEDRPVAEAYKEAEDTVNAALEKEAK